MKKSRLSQTSLFIVLICVFLLIVNVSLGYVLIMQSSKAIRSLIESRMLDVSNTAAALLDGDTLETLEAEDKDTPAYQEAYKMLSCFEDNIELEYIYCVRDMGDGSFVFMIDPDAEAPGEFGEHIPYTDALYQASLGVPSVDKEPYVDEWGRFYSAYSPVFDSEKKVAGIVAVDFSADWYERQITGQVTTTLVISTVSLVFASIIILLLAARYRRRFTTLISEMNEVSGGIETLVRETSPGTAIASGKEDGAPQSNDEMTMLGQKIHSLQSQLSKQIAYVRSMAYVDALTGLGNRAAYDKHVRQLEDDIARGKANFAVGVFDINGLKEINDGYGHAKGDKVIIEAARNLKQAFENGKVYRIGGDEFIVLVEGADPARLINSAELAAEKSLVSMSKGCAAYEPGKDQDYIAVFNRADSAMYTDKRAYYLTHEDRRRS